MLEIQSKQMQPDIVVLQLTGRMTLGRQCKQLEWAVDNLVGEGRKKVIFDFSGVTNVDSTGIGVIVMSAGQVKKAGGELRVAGATGQVQQVLKMTNIHQIIALHPSTAAAAANF
ncbi:MAG: STAS domain-containing protein [Terriglobales bacterium]